MWELYHFAASLFCQSKVMQTLAILYRGKSLGETINLPKFNAQNSHARSHMQALQQFCTLILILKSPHLTWVWGKTVETLAIMIVNYEVLYGCSVPYMYFIPYAYGTPYGMYHTHMVQFCILICKLEKNCKVLS